MERGVIPNHVLEYEVVGVVGVVGVVRVVECEVAKSRSREVAKSLLSKLIDRKRKAVAHEGVA